MVDDYFNPKLFFIILFVCTMFSLTGVFVGGDLGTIQLVSLLMLYLLLF